MLSFNLPVGSKLRTFINIGYYFNYYYYYRFTEYKKFTCIVLICDSESLCVSESTIHKYNDVLYLYYISEIHWLHQIILCTCILLICIYAKFGFCYPYPEVITP